MPDDRETIRAWLDSCKPLTAEAGAAMRRVLAAGPRLTYTEPVLNVTIPQAGVCGLMTDPSAPRDSDALGCTIPAEPMSLADNSLPVIDGTTEAVSPRGRSFCQSQKGQ